MASAGRYLEIADSLRERIDGGEWEPGDNLPIHTELAKEYGVSRNVVAAAIKKLESEERVWAVPRRGTIVRHRQRRAIMRTNVVRRNTRHVANGEEVAAGYSFPAAQGNELWVHHTEPDVSEVPMTDARLAHMLNVKVGAKILRRLRVTGPPDEPPFQISATWIHPRGVADAPRVKEPYGTGPGAWLDRLEESGHGPIEWMERRRARMPEPAEAGLLKVPTSLPVWEIVRIGYSAKDENAIEVTQVIIPSDRMEEVSRLMRDESARWPHEETGADGPPVAGRGKDSN
ncbi:GntR family transcriptional regulator [Actinomadura barringtoniae]|uniref:GntR family transcriptional regulator n=1 Tax=Actinomadura barringtoniae TaxID=1427535 RepID=A0A939PNZ5_9ACTN|nr:GntR family transcriptional regulator [Actinomadura barringtoniae]MBO2452569.1 GntR family transcriptional regulator [Actinomadura barringtoniae]